MTSIDIKDLQSSIMKIEELIDSNIWEKNIDYIIESKNKCINEFNVYHRIAEICMQSNLNVAQINKEKVNIKKKTKLITFVGKLNSAKGYDLFGNSIIKILNKYKNWK